MIGLVLLLTLPGAVQEASADPRPDGAGAARLDPVVVEGSIEAGDGTKLIHSLIHPAGDGPWPVVLVRTPYGRPAGVAGAKPFLDAGMAVLVQDVRGTGDSGGEWRPFVHEPADGAATFDWLKAQEWCDGRIATWGMSYLGITQWQLAPHAGAELDAMVVQFSTADVFRDLVHFGGVQGLGVALPWIEGTHGERGPPRFGHLPLIEADDATGTPAPAWDDWCNHPVLDEYWKPLDYDAKYAEVKAPVLLVAGWYDLFLPGQIDDYMRLAQRAGPIEQTFARLIIGPWDHAGPAMTLGRPDLGEHAYVAPHQEERDFLERFALGVQNGYDMQSGVRAFFLGENAWREVGSWPPADSRECDFFLRSRGGASLKPGDGLLLRDRPPSQPEPPDEFTYDPADPCPSYAGSLWTPLSTLADQKAIAQRTDVLTYWTAPLPRDVAIAGPITLELWVESDAPDTDFAAKLLDASREGPMEWRGEGIQRARLRAGPYDEQLLEPGVPAKITIDMGHIAARFAEGHRLGIQVTSSNFPRFSRNLNTEERSNVAAQPRIARQRVLHDPDHPSKLILHVLKRDD